MSGSRRRLECRHLAAIGNRVRKIFLTRSHPLVKPETKPEAACTSQGAAWIAQCWCELIQYATEIKVRAERQAGAMLKDASERGDRHHQGRAAADDKPTTLGDLGISANQSSRWQSLASMTEEHFETAVARGPDLDRLVGTSLDKELDAITFSTTRGPSGPFSMVGALGSLGATSGACVPMKIQPNQHSCGFWATVR